MKVIPQSLFFRATRSPKPQLEPSSLNKEVFKCAALSHSLILHEAFEVTTLRTIARLGRP